MSRPGMIWSEGDPPTTPTSGTNGWINARTTTPYHPPTNWMVERFNRNLKLVIHAAYADGQDLEEKVAGQTSQGCQGKRQEGEGGCKKPPQQETPGPTPGV